MCYDERAHVSYRRLLEQSESWRPYITLEMIKLSETQLQHDVNCGFIPERSTTQMHLITELIGAILSLLPVQEKVIKQIVKRLNCSIAVVHGLFRPR